MGNYSEQEKQGLLQKLYDLAEEMGSINKTVPLTGVSSTVISQLRSGKYKGNEDSMYEKLEAYFKARESSTELNIGNDDYVPTSISENVYAIIKNSQLKGGLAIACGDAGVGKTRAAQKFVADNPNLSMLITINPCLKGSRSVLKLLCDRLSVNERTLDEMWLGVANKLRDKMVLIFDEAQHLPIKTIEALRAFSDYFTDKGQTLGIVFIGNMEAVHNFNGNRRADFAQIVNRTKQNRQYYTRNITRADIEKLFPELKGRDKELDFMLAIAQSKQAIRGASNLYSNASDNEDTSYNGLVAMAKAMEMSI